MTLNRVLPSSQHLIIVVLLDTNASLVLNLGELSSTLLVHAILQIASHCAVTLTHLAQHISLVSLLLVGDSECVLFVGSVLPIDIGIDILLVVLLKPGSFVLESRLEENVLLTVLVYVLEQVDASLVLTAPLLLTSIPLLLVFNLGKLFNHLLIRCLVGLSILVVLLELLNFPTASQSLFRLNLFDGSLATKSCVEKNLIPVTVNLLSLLT